MSPPEPPVRPGAFAVIGSEPQLTIQVLLAVRAFSRAPCLAVTSAGDPAVRRSRLAHNVLEASFDGRDDDRIVTFVNEWVERRPGTVAVAADCVGTRLVHRIGARLRASMAPVPDPTTLERFDNKWTFYEFCRRHGLPVPESVLVPSKQELDFDRVAREIGVPFVIKPLDQQASTGVHVIRDVAQWRRVLDDEAYRHAPLMVQRFIPGIDACIDLFATNGVLRGLACQQREWPQQLGAAIRFFGHAELERIARRLCEVSRYHGVLLLDTRIEEGTGRAYLVEANPRFWRSLSAAVWGGLNFAEQSVSGGNADPATRQLTTGRTDTYYHPFFRPSLWPYLVLPGRRGRMARLMAGDLGTLATQGRGALRRLKRLASGW